MSKNRHVNWVDVVDEIGPDFGWTSVDNDKSLIDLFNDPPRSHSSTVDSRQHTLLLVGLLNAVKDLIKSTDGVRRAIDRIPEKTEKARLAAQVKLAQEERKAAEARERAAIAEFDTKFSQPPVMVQCDNETMDRLIGVRQRF